MSRIGQNERALPHYEAIAAALELGRRYLAEAAVRQATVNGPEDVVDMMLPLLKGLDHEECWALFLNRANVVTGKEKLTSGTVDCTLIERNSVSVPRAT